MKVIIKRFFYLLGKDNLKLSFLIFLGTLFSAFLEVLSVGSVIPLATMIFSEKAQEVAYVSFFLDRFSENDLYFLFAVFIVLIFIVKSFYQGILFYFQGLFTAKVSFDLSNNLYEKYIESDYIDHIKENSAKKVQFITNESNLAVQGFLKPTLSLLTETLVVISISILLMFFDLISFLLIFSIISFAFFLSTFLTNKILRRLGEKRAEYEIQRLKDVQQSLFGFKYLKLSDTIEYAKNLFGLSNRGIASIRAKEFFYRQTVRPFLELFIILSMVFLAYFLFIRGLAQSEILILITLYLSAAIRLLPSVNRIIGDVQSLNFFSEIVSKLYFAYLGKNTNKRDNFLNKSERNDHFISIENLSFKYSETSKEVLSKINLNVEKDKFIVLVGESGSGKSTFINLLVGLLEPSSGGIFHRGENILNLKSNWFKKIGYVPQDVYLIDDSIRKNIAFGLPDNQIDNKKVMESIAKANLKSFLDSQRDGLDTFIGENAVNISGGQKQRIAIARSLYHNPDIIVFDEATSALDKETEKEILKDIVELGENKTIFFSTHKPEILKSADIIIEFKLGKINILK